jgi:hypothetical protein
MTPKPGATPLWLAGLKTQEEAEKKKNKSNKKAVRYGHC